MIISGIAYLVGAALTTGAVPRSSGLIMLVVGRVSLGVGVGFANSVSSLTALFPLIIEVWELLALSIYSCCIADWIVSIYSSLK